MAFQGSVSVLTVVGPPDTSGVEYYAQTHKTQRFAKWAECTMCNHVDTQDKMGQIDGKWYCHRYDCYDEARDRKIQQRRKNHGDR